jgi:hypothetical protein
MIFAVLGWPKFFSKYGDELLYHSFNLAPDCASIGSEIFLLQRSSTALEGSVVIVGYKSFEKAALRHLKERKLEYRQEIKPPKVFIEFNHQNLGSLVNLLKHLDKNGVSEIVLDFNTSIWTDFTFQKTVKQRFIKKPEAKKISFIEEISNTKFVLKNIFDIVSERECPKIKQYIKPKNIFSGSFITEGTGNAYEHDLKKLSKLSKSVKMSWIFDKEYYNTELVMLPDTRGAILEFVATNDDTYGRVISY